MTNYNISGATKFWMGVLAIITIAILPFVLKSWNFIYNNYFDYLVGMLLIQAAIVFVPVIVILDWSNICFEDLTVSIIEEFTPVGLFLSFIFLQIPFIILLLILYLIKGIMLINTWANDNF